MHWIKHTLLTIILTGYSHSLLAHGTHMTRMEHPSPLSHLFLEHAWLIAALVLTALVVYTALTRSK